MKKLGVTPTDGDQLIQTTDTSSSGLPSFAFAKKKPLPQRRFGKPCPWYKYPAKVDGILVRTIAFFVFLSSVTTLVLSHAVGLDGAWYIIPVLFYDFVVRTTNGALPFSPVGYIATFCLVMLKVPPKPGPSVAKRFSSFLGVLLLLAATILVFATDNRVAVTILIGMLVALSGLEAFFGFCLGCFFWKHFFIWKDARYAQKRRKMFALKKGPAHKVPKSADKFNPHEKHPYDYDLVVIGGGSGGLACAREAARLGQQVVLFDYVDTSTNGNTWKIGGTCVNVGCIPKKLYHTASLVGHNVEDRGFFGFDVPTTKNPDEMHKEKPELNWEVLRFNIYNHIHSLNWGYVSALRKEGIQYVNAKASFIDPHTLKAVTPNGTNYQITARRVLIAVGGRPAIPHFPGAEHVITSDDVFMLKKAPGKTLVVGASYIALECAGFLAALGYDVHVLVRSILLRGFDRDMARRIEEDMTEMGVKFIRECIPHSLEKQEDGQLLMKWSKTNDKENTVAGEDVFDTVLVATGRVPSTKSLNLPAAGVETDRSGKIHVYHERTTTPHIYALGDVIVGGLELTPVAIQAGRYLAKRLYDGGDDYMDYDNVATTVFTPLEYSVVGMSEERAMEMFGEPNVEVFHSEFTPLEWAVLPMKDTRSCYTKVITNSLEGGRVVGIHYLGPNAGEVMQGFAMAMKSKMNIFDFLSVVGIHPVAAEEIVNLRSTKRSGVDPKKSGC
eukprot:GCRY01000360.1.p1 GENE.GCRY01000360.1~~GCRY01000360.1.p1  ORF type:complete len:763 (-),score=138.45 GCRY01000360.1:428-2602(-)